MLSRRKFRLGNIGVIYKYELFDKEININEVFQENQDLTNEQFLEIEKLKKNYSFYKKIISSFLNADWKWERISPLLRAILIYAVHELFLIEPRIVINEAVEITKYYFEDEKNYYKWINAILQNIYKYLVVQEAKLREEKNNDHDKKTIN
ncbi:transcription antitermination factor NusB [Mycoplasmopsis lipofaciens]|uniref:transcription antitermination factor NusB n=1 Tax=Mycoplasmopsis lipofaciens TaxID=114884 RepID=UPI00047FD8E2|nr:transcription antitermination factor NusB [Mycoplasmopsis lipofaciens]